MVTEQETTNLSTFVNTEHTGNTSRSKAGLCIHQDSLCAALNSQCDFSNTTQRTLFCKFEPRSLLRELQGKIWLQRPVQNDRDSASTTLQQELHRDSARHVALSIRRGVCGGVGRRRRGGPGGTTASTLTSDAQSITAARETYYIILTLWQQSPTLIKSNTSSCPKRTEEVS